MISERFLWRNCFPLAPLAPNNDTTTTTNNNHYTTTTTNNNNNNHNHNTTITTTTTTTNNNDNNDKDDDNDNDKLIVVIMIIIIAIIPSLVGSGRWSVIEIRMFWPFWRASTIAFISSSFSFGEAAREFQEFQFVHKPGLGIPTSSP